MNGRQAATAGLLAAGAAMWAAAAADLDSGHSTLSAQYGQMNVPVDAPFRRFSGNVQFDPAQPGAATAHIEIETASLDLGEEDYSSEVRKPEWFDSARFPKASFDAKGLKPAGPGKYETDGTLALKGKSQQVHVTVALKDLGGGALALDGSVPISRTYFDIGGADWKDSVADQVLVKFHLVTRSTH